MARQRSSTGLRFAPPRDEPRAFHGASRRQSVPWGYPGQKIRTLQGVSMNHRPGLPSVGLSLLPVVFGLGALGAQEVIDTAELSRGLSDRGAVFQRAARTE